MMLSIYSTPSWRLEEIQPYEISDNMKGQPTAELYGTLLTTVDLDVFF